MADDRIPGAPVGIGQPNDPADVRHVQHLLNRHLATPSGDGHLAEDGIFGPHTQARLTEYQRDAVRLAHPDAVVDVHGPTLRSLSRPAEHATAGRGEVVHHPAHPAAPDPGPSIQELTSSHGATRATDRHPAGSSEHLTHRQFVDEMLPHARAVHEKWGVPVSVVLAQSSVESNWGNRHPDNVYFGVKGHAPDGKSVMLMTHEEVKGERVLVPQRFRAYDSLAAAADDYGRFLKSNERYKGAFEHPDDGIAFMKKVAAAGYASDSGYATTLESRMRNHGMLQYDDHSPRLTPGSVPPALPANRDAPGATPAGRAANPTDPQALWAAVAERGRQSVMARQSAVASHDPLAAQVGPSLMQNQNDPATRKDLVGGWQAAQQAGTVAKEVPQQAASAVPVAAPSAPRMKL